MYVCGWVLYVCGWVLYVGAPAGRIRGSFFREEKVLDDVCLKTGQHSTWTTLRGKIRNRKST